MYMIYWSKFDDGTATPQCKDFATQDMNGALRFMEGLRKEQRNGAKLGFIGMTSEHPDSVGLPGVDETGPEYNWKKRRQ